MMKKIIILIIRGYQRILSPDQGVVRIVFRINKNYCTMYPSCSEYMITAIEKYGVLKGFLKGVHRVLRCHPYQKNIVDIP